MIASDSGLNLNSVDLLLEEYEKRTKQYQTPVVEKVKKSKKKKAIAAVPVEESTPITQLTPEMFADAPQEGQHEEIIPVEELAEEFKDRYSDKDPLHLLTEEETRRLMTIDEVCELVDKNFGLDLVVMDLREKCSFAEYLVFVTGSSTRHMKTLAKSVVQELISRKLFKLKPTIEGETDEQWMVVDAGNIVVQVFSPEGRRSFDLERKWAFHSRADFEPTLEDLAKAYEPTKKGKKKRSMMEE